MLESIPQFERETYFRWLITKKGSEPQRERYRAFVDLYDRFGVDTPADLLEKAASESSPVVENPQIESPALVDRQAVFAIDQPSSIAPDSPAAAVVVAGESSGASAAVDRLVVEEGFIKVWSSLALSRKVNSGAVRVYWLARWFLSLIHI